MRGDDFAFPWDELNSCEGLYAQHPGLTKREYIAIEMMKAWITAQPVLGGVTLSGSREDANALAQVAINYADAVISNIEKEAHAKE